MERWMELTLSLPQGGFESPRKFREILAHANSQSDPLEKIDSRIFHYTADVKPDVSVPLIRFGARAGKPQLYAIGDCAMEILNAEAHKIVRMMERHCNTTIDEQRTTRAFRVAVNEWLSPYWTPLIVFQNEPRQHKRFQADIRRRVVTEELTRFITAKITRSIERQCRALGFDLDETGYILGDVEISGDILPIKMKDGVFALAAKDLSFRTSLDLSGGPWHVGHLTAKGYGRIYQGCSGRGQR